MTAPLPRGFQSYGGFSKPATGVHVRDYDHVCVGSKMVTGCGVAFTDKTPNTKACSACKSAAKKRAA